MRRFWEAGWQGYWLTPWFGSSEVGDSAVKVMPVVLMGSCFAKGRFIASPFRAVKDIFLDVLCFAVAVEKTKRCMTQEENLKRRVELDEVLLVNKK